MIVERPGLERRVLAATEAARIPVVLGASGTGRTSLLLRLAQLMGPSRGQYLDLSAVATTPEHCLAAIVTASSFRLRGGQMPPLPDSPRAAFDALLRFFDDAVAPDGGPVTFLLDEVLDVRTFESFPGLRQVQRDLIGRLAVSPNRFVLSSGFTSRTHRLLRDAPARFEVMHVPALDASEVAALGMLFDPSRPERARAGAPAVAALAAGRATYACHLLSTIARTGSTLDPLAALAALLGPDGRLTATCRACYEFRLHRARGYGALKAILGVLAEVEPLNLTEISLRLQRTPGSTKDYLSWLEDVDLVTVQRKRYTFDDPMLRLYVRLYGRAFPPSEDDVVREIHTYARARLPLGGDGREPALAVVDQNADSDISLRIAEID